MDTEFTVEKLLQVGIGAPVEVQHTDTIEDELVKSRLNPVDLIADLINNISPANHINKHTTYTHFQNRALEGTGKGIGPLRVVVELGVGGREYVVGDAAVKAVIRHIPFEVR